MNSTVKSIGWFLTTVLLIGFMWSVVWSLAMDRAEPSVGERCDLPTPNELWCYTNTHGREVCFPRGGVSWCNDQRDADGGTYCRRYTGTMWSLDVKFATGNIFRDWYTSEDSCNKERDNLRSPGRDPLSAIYYCVNTEHGRARSCNYVR